MLDQRRKILLLGSTGQVGHELKRLLTPLAELTAMTRSDFHHESPDEVERVLTSLRPDIIINAAAYTQVEQAEIDFNSATQINTILPECLAAFCRRRSSLLVHYSTDYVFDGSKNSPYLESDQTNPLNVYGKTKLEGEVRIVNSGCRAIILRTSSVFSNRGRNFVLTILKLAGTKDEIPVVSDQTMCPTSASQIAQATCEILNRDSPPLNGIFHVTSPDTATWFEFAEEILKQAAPYLKNIPKVRAIMTSQYPSNLKRPLYTVLSSERIKREFNIKLPSWKLQLSKVIGEIFQ